MAAININQDGYSRRLAAVEKILQNFGLHSRKVTPLAYIENGSFPYNNFIYKVDLAAPAKPSSFEKRQPGTTPPPAEGLSTVVVRINNIHALDINNTNRIQNDVASQFLARESLSASGYTGLVPAVYAYAAPKSLEAKDESDFGWVIAEFKQGVDLDTVFATLAPADKAAVLEQIAGILAGIQKAILPSSVENFGGLSFNASGDIISGEMSVLQGGPWGSYEEVWEKKFREQLDDAQKSELLQGWKPNGVLERIENFLVNDGIKKTLADVDTTQRILIHGDFTTNNMLFDTLKNTITAVVDFDFATVTHPLDEYLTGLGDISCISNDIPAIRKAILTGDFTVTPSNMSEDEETKWTIARLWHEATVKQGVHRPDMIRGVESIVALQTFAGSLCPFMLGNDDLRKRMDEAQQFQKRAETEKQIVEWLAQRGF